MCTGLQDSCAATQLEHTCFSTVVMCWQYLYDTWINYFKKTFFQGALSRAFKVLNRNLLHIYIQGADDSIHILQHFYYTFPLKIPWFWLQLTMPNYRYRSHFIYRETSPRKPNLNDTTKFVNSQPYLKT